MKLTKQLRILKDRLDELKSAYGERLEIIQNKLIELITQTQIIANQWAGSWFEDPHTYNDFTVNSQGCIELSYEDVKKIAESKSNIDSNLISEEVLAIFKEYQEFNNELLVELSIIRSNEQFIEQVKLLDKIEKYQWGYPSEKFIKHQQPKYFMGDFDIGQRLLTQGFETPPHIAFAAKILSKASQVDSMIEHSKLSYRLLRELELIFNVDKSEFEELGNYLMILDRLFDKFHDVARQLENRHGGRETLLISDEYDVQDLLSALLKINFDDIRPEDYTPSFAGRNTRLDFLLKKERVVIEVKKTRASLKDKEIGDELLQDIARYKNHPDCDILYCFVYDPQGLIMNPRGLENDLNSESNESLKVIVRIKP